MFLKISIVLLILVAYTNGQPQVHARSASESFAAHESTTTQAKGGDALVKAVRSGDVAAVRALLASGVRPDAQDSEGNLALSWAVRFDRPEIITALLDAGANVNARESDGDTPLMIAATVGRKSTVETLLAKGARINDKDKGGHTPLILAGFGLMLKRMPETLATLLLAGNDAGAKEELDQLRKSMGNEYVEVVSLLIERGADVNARAEDCGMSALLVSAVSGDVEMVKLLLARGARLNAVDEKSEALFMFATMPVTDLERMLANDPSVNVEEKQAILKWLRDTAPQRADITRLLKEAAQKK